MHNATGINLDFEPCQDSHSDCTTQAWMFDAQNVLLSPLRSACLCVVACGTGRCRVCVVPICVCHGAARRRLPCECRRGVLVSVLGLRCHRCKNGRGHTDYHGHVHVELHSLPGCFSGKAASIAVATLLYVRVRLCAQRRIVLRVPVDLAQTIVNATRDNGGMARVGVGLCSPSGCGRKDTVNVSQQLEFLAHHGVQEVDIWAVPVPGYWYPLF